MTGGALGWPQRSSKPPETEPLGYPRTPAKGPLSGYRYGSREQQQALRDQEPLTSVSSEPPSQEEATEGDRRDSGRGNAKPTRKMTGWV